MWRLIVAHNVQTLVRGDPQIKKLGAESLNRRHSQQHVLSLDNYKGKVSVCIPSMSDITILYIGTIVMFAIYAA